MHARDCTAHVNDAVSEGWEMERYGVRECVCVSDCVCKRESTRESMPESESAPALLRGSVVFIMCACLHCALFVFSAFSR